MWLSLSAPSAAVSGSVRVSLIVGPLLLMGCKSTTEATEQELHERLVGQTVLFLGCPAECPAGSVCGTDAVDRLETDLATRPLVIEAVARGGEVRRSWYYFVDERGAGTRYYEVSTDVAHCDDCGWHKTPFVRLEVERKTAVGSFTGSLPSTGVTLRADGDMAQFSIGPAGCD